MKKYVETQLTELKNKNSAECIRMIRQNSDSISKMSQTIAEKYEKVTFIHTNLIRTSPWCIG